MNRPIIQWWDLCFRPLDITTFNNSTIYIEGDERNKK